MAPLCPSATRLLLSMFEKNCPDDQDDQPNKKHKNGNPVDPMHIPHPLRIRRIRVPLFDVEIFLYLTPDTHIISLKSPLKVINTHQNNTPRF